MRFTIRSRLSTSLPGLFIAPTTHRVILSEAKDPATVESLNKRCREFSPALWLRRTLVLPHCSSLNPPLVQLPLKNPLHINRRCMHRVPIQLADIHEML